ncbi:MAG: AraC family transcriptional regulator [Clostridiales bacterium]|nr:AraC family transcriptional regulator [Clostridiales bacterium]
MTISGGDIINDTMFFKSEHGIVLKYAYRNTDYIMPSKHFHNLYEIYYLSKGERYYFIDEKKYHVHAGDLVIIDYNQIHQTMNAENPMHERILLQITKTAVDTLFKDTCFENILPLSGRYGVLRLEEHERKKVEYLLFDMLREATNKSIGYDLMILIHLKEFLIFLSRKLSQRALPLYTENTLTIRDKKMLEMAEYIKNNHSTIQNLEDLSKQFYLDKSYICRKFKEATGYTPSEYLNIKRIQHAQQLLNDDRYNINDISNIVGYKSPSTFIKRFKAHMNMSPLEYRKLLKRNSRGI